MRLAILAVDGMDYWRCRVWKLKLAGHTGRVESRTDLATPQLWAMIISGDCLRTDRFAINKAPLWVHALTKPLPAGVRRRIFGRWYVWPGKEYLRRPAIFDEVRKAVVIDFPAYNWELYPVFRKYSLAAAAGDPRRSREILECVDERDREKIERFYDALLEDDWDICACWLYIIDVANHLFPRNRRLIRDLYGWMQTVIDVAKMHAREAGALLVVLSDHGGRDGVHTPDAVVSVSDPSIPLLRRIEEVHGWLKQLLNM